MMALPWIVFALLALFWTGGAAVTAWAIDWLAQALADGGAAQAAGELVAMPVPQWIALWLDPAWVQAMQSGLLWALEAGRGWLPLAGSAAGWLVPLVWVTWALGLLVLLAGAAGVHLLVRRLRPRPLAH
jgi:hypothetical protein